VALGWNRIRQKQQVAAWGLLAAVVLIFTVRTVVRNWDWRDSLALYSSGVRAVPNDSKMHSNLAGQYLIRNRLDEAEREYQIAFRIEPDSPDTLSSFAALELHKGNYQAAGVLMEKALGMSGRNNLNYDFMVVTFADILMRTNHADGAFEYLDREISEAPAYAPAWSMRATAHYQQGDLAAARADAETALRLNPQDPQSQGVLQRLNDSVPSSVQP
jgi:tetratricopeptide (TPR) repeat protein